jgi:DNA-directed RNA polymerase subunit H (RpoH/RPB5)
LITKSKLTRENTEFKVFCKNPENIITKMDDAISQVPKFKYKRSVSSEDGKSKGDIIQRVTKVKVTFNNKSQLLCLKNISL